MDQAMEQLKEFLRQCIKYRFWISVGVAALFSTIAYILGAGPVQAKAEKETAAIKQAADGVKPFTKAGIPNAQYKPIVDERTEILTKDVNSAWKQLYSRQAPLLTWPKPVEERFRAWGRKWPESVAPNAVEVAKVDYVMAYPEYVEQVYRTFNPFNYETGTGIVAAQPKEVLLKQSVFDLTKLPELGQIWAGQERLWVQRTVLEVVAAVNKKAKDWDSAIIKQINLLEVGNNLAQDQRSIAKNEELQESEKIDAPGSESQDQTAASTSGGTGGAMGAMADAMRNYMGRRGDMGGSAGAMASAPESIYYLKPEAAKDQYKILPVMLSVLIDQDHVQDLLVEMVNSPMAIQVMEFELQRPTSHVTKPEKGTMGNFAAYGDSMMMSGMMRRGGPMGSMAGYGGMMANYAAMMQNMGEKRGGMMGPMSPYGMMSGGYGTAAQARKGVDKRATNRGEQRKEETKAAESAKSLTLFDPYYDIVELKVYGQARFYNSPPPDAATEPSPGEVAAKAAESGEPQAAGAAAAESATKAETTKTEAAKAEAPKAEPPKADSAKTEPPKAEAPKAGPVKAEAPKAEAPKAEAPKAEPAKENPNKNQGSPSASPKG